MFRTSSQDIGIPAIEASVHVYTHPLRDFLLAGIITLSCYLMNRSLKSRKVMMEMQQLKIENIANQFEALKNQLNPHMLFNSLNTLYSLIRESPEKAPGISERTVKSNEIYLTERQ